MKLLAFDRQPELFKIPDTDASCMVQFLDVTKKATLIQYLSLPDIEKVFEIAIKCGVGKVINIQTPGGNDITNGPDLWRVFKSIDPKHLNFFSSIANRVLDKNDIGVMPGKSKDTAKSKLHVIKAGVK